MKHEDGFYVRAEPNLCTPNVTIKYISRYLGRPVIATSRIDHYNRDFVTFHYTCQEDNKTVSECAPTSDFIKRINVHIPEKHFKMLRYYGIYAKHHKPILLSFGDDPLCCQKCGSSMLVLFTTKKLHYLNDIDRG